MFYTLQSKALAACACAATLGISAVAASPDYMVTDLGTLGGKTTQAFAMNDFDVVVGCSQLVTPVDPTIVAPMHAFVWRNGVMEDLGTLGGDFSEARSINNRGEIVGVSLDADGEPCAFYAYGGQMYDFNRFLTYGKQPLIKTVVEVNDINEYGDIIGCGFAAGDDALHGYLFRPIIGTGSGFDKELAPLGVDLGETIAPRPELPVNMDRTIRSPGKWIPPHYQAIDLGKLDGADDCLPLSVNSFNDIVGVSGPWGFMCHHEGAIDYLDVTKLPSQGNSCNDFAYTVGWWCHGAEGENTAAIWNAHCRLDLPVSNSFGAISEANDVNDQFDVVGWVLRPGELRSAVLWDNVTPAIDLFEHTVQPMSAEIQYTHLEEAIAVNERGHIIGQTTVLEGHRAFILERLYDMRHEVRP